MSIDNGRAILNSGATSGPAGTEVANILTRRMNAKQILKLLSVDREIQLLSRIFSLAIERGEVEVNPCLRIEMLGTGNQVLRYLKPEEEQRLFAVLEM